MGDRSKLRELTSKRLPRERRKHPQIFLAICSIVFDPDSDAVRKRAVDEILRPLVLVEPAADRAVFGVGRAPDHPAQIVGQLLR
jgi:hypothetical protein